MWTGFLPNVSDIGDKQSAPTNIPANIAAPIIPTSSSSLQMRSRSTTQLLRLYLSSETILYSMLSMQATSSAQGIQLSLMNHSSGGMSSKNGTLKTISSAQAKAMMRLLMIMRNQLFPHTFFSSSSRVFINFF